MPRREQPAQYVIRALAEPQSRPLDHTMHLNIDLDRPHDRSRKGSYKK
jgi:hypothetical protein